MARDNVVFMADKKGDARLWSVEDALRDALEDVKEGKRKAAKVLVLFLNDEDGAYDVNFVQAGLKASECIALCAVSENMFKQDMGY